MSGALTAIDTSVSGRRATSFSVLLLTRAVIVSSVDGAGAAASAEPSASSRRRSGSRSSYSRKRVAQRRAVRGLRDVRLQVELERDVALDGRELLGDARVVGVVGQVFLALGAADVVDVGQHLLERPESLQQVGRGLVADPGDARDVVAGVALQPDEVGHELRRDPVALDHALAVVDLGVGDAARGGHDPHAVADELVGVAVAGDDHHRDRRVFLAGSLDDRGDHVVGLVALDGEVLVAERRHERLERGPLLLEQAGATGALGLVLGVDLLAARVALVPHHDGGLRAVVGEDLHQHRGEPENRVRRDARGGGDRLGQREERAVREAVAVDQEELVGHLLLRLVIGRTGFSCGPLHFAKSLRNWGRVGGLRGMLFGVRELDEPERRH